MTITDLPGVPGSGSTQTKIIQECSIDIGNSATVTIGPYISLLLHLSASLHFHAGSQLTSSAGSSIVSDSSPCELTLEQGTKWILNTGGDSGILLI
jgi:hypothetical protein